MAVACVSLHQVTRVGEPSAGGASAGLHWPFLSCMDPPACNPQGIHPHRAAFPAAEKLLEGQQPVSHCPPEPTLPCLVLALGTGCAGTFPVGFMCVSSSSETILQNVINERFNQTQPASTDGNLVVEENIAYLFVYLPLCSWGDALTLVESSSCLVAPGGTDWMWGHCQPHALAGLPSNGIFLLPLSSTAPFSFQELVWTSSSLHPTFPTAHDGTRMWS